jgi:sulfide:quinone oxidoreductase
MAVEPRVVIVGGGFAGLRVLHRLHRAAAVTLVDERETSVSKPALPEVALAGKPVAQARFPIGPTVRRHGARHIQAAAHRIDASQRTVVLADGSSIPYDYVVLAPGARKAYDAIPGLEEHGYSVCDDEHAQRLAEALAAFRGGPVVVGSAPSRFGTRVPVPELQAACEGPVGEVAFMAVHELARRKLDGPVSVFTPGRVFFEDVGPAVHAEVEPLLAEAGITVHVGKTIASVGRDHVAFADGTALEAALAVVVPPYAGPPLLAASDLADDAGFLPTDSAMRHLDVPRVLGAGDATALAMPKLGHLAVHQADLAAAAIVADATGKGEVPEYRPEIFCVMDRGGAEATLILSDHVYGGATDLARSGPLPRLLKWTFDAYHLHTRGHLPPDALERALAFVLRA